MVISNIENAPLSCDLIFIRHGTTLWNQEKRYLGHTDIGLLPEAKQELALLREQLRNLSWSKLYSSDLLRCQQTLTSVTPLQREQAHLDARLREIDFGEWEGKTYDQLQHIQQYRNWIDDPQNVTPPKGESWQAFTARIDSFLNTCLLHDALSEPVTVDVPQMGIVTHGGVIRYAISRLIPDLNFWDTQVIPGQAIKVRLDYGASGWVGSQVAFP
ncbi:histidine phosphatase family protein [Paenibacillus tundrae]|uniref:Alpha-ribazole phosphatase n=1 Tax=Paenibacillus tundrae TaxID=528187 RepID=A0ABT9WBF9_9BACL|nr:histidine phosphatase family protein [Paenibacillus tundrae]MDQ0170450.1 alpha-ribazole phosphatase [Paenibacillus tundrae]